MCNLSFFFHLHIKFWYNTLVHWEAIILELRGGAHASLGLSAKEKPVSKWNAFYLVCSRWVLMSQPDTWRCLHWCQRGKHRSVGRTCDLCPILAVPLWAEPLHSTCHWAVDPPQLQRYLESRWRMVCSLSILGCFIFRAVLRVIEKYTTAHTRQ